MSRRVRAFLGTLGIAALLAGVAYIDSMPEWLIGVFAAALALCCIVGWLVTERRIDREAGIR